MATAAFGCSRSTAQSDENLLSPSTLASPTLPFVASFTVAEDGEYQPGFGDGTTKIFSASGCPGSASCTASHSYESAGVFHVGLSNARSAAGWSEVAVGGTQTVPTLTAISPSHGAVGSSIQLSGSGFIGLNGSVVVDGKPGFPNTKASTDLVPTSDSLLSFDFPTGFAEPCECPAGSNCECELQSFEPGLHSIAVENEKGTSNAVTFTVDP